MPLLNLSDFRFTAKECVKSLDSLENGGIYRILVNFPESLLD